MKKFIALYMAPVAAMDEMRKNPNPEKDKKWMDSWNAWMEEHKASFVDVGAPAGANKRVMKDSVKDVRNEVTGYSVVQAESHDEAAKLFQGNPMLQMPGAYVEVMEWVPMKG
jgi:hypothetical protein